MIFILNTLQRVYTTNALVGIYGASPLSIYITSLFRKQCCLASFPDLPVHLQTLYARLLFYFPLLVEIKKIIAHIMFAGEREGLGTRLMLLWHPLVSPHTHHKVFPPLRVAGATQDPSFVDHWATPKLLLPLVRWASVETDLDVELQVICRT